MSRVVKVGGTSRISSKNQVTLPVAILNETGLEAGDRLIVTGSGPGRVTLERASDVIDEFAGALTGRSPRTILEELDREWD